MRRSGPLSRGPRSPLRRSPDFDTDCCCELAVNSKSTTVASRRGGRYPRCQSRVFHPHANSAPPSPGGAFLSCNVVHCRHAVAARAMQTRPLVLRFGHQKKQKVLPRRVAQAGTSAGCTALAVGRRRESAMATTGMGAERRKPWRRGAPLLAAQRGDQDRQRPAAGTAMDRQHSARAVQRAGRAAGDQPARHRIKLQRAFAALTNC